MKDVENARNAFTKKDIKFDRESNELVRIELADIEAKEIERKVNNSRRLNIKYISTQISVNNYMNYL